MRKIVILFCAIIFISCGTEKRSAQESAGLRVISMAPSVTEMVYALGAQKQLVAVTDYCKYPPQARQKESIGGLLNPNLEKITALRPDLILATESYRGLEKRFPNHNFRVLYLPESTMESVFVSLDSLGNVMGKPATADSLVAKIQADMEALKAAPGQAPVSAMLVLGRDAAELRRISVIGPGAYIDAVWRWVGGSNVFSDLPAAFAQVNREEIISRQPDVLIDFVTADSVSRQQVSKVWQPLTGHLDAVKSDRVYVLRGARHLIPGPRMVELARSFKGFIAQARLNSNP